jgi:hypothetical protein
VQAAPITFAGTLSGLNEVAPNASPGTGFVTVVFDPVAHTLFVDATFSGLTGLTTAAHIHCCTPPGANASVATQTPSFSGFPLGVTGGTFSNTYDMTLATSYRAGFIAVEGGTTVAGAEAALFAGMLAGNTYFNIHTQAFPGGEIRANLAAVPEPATLLLVGLGLAAAVVARRHTSRREHAS